MLHCCGDDA
jgi:hypothetical protein